MEVPKAVFLEFSRIENEIQGIPILYDIGNV